MISIRSAQITELQPIDVGQRRIILTRSSLDDIRNIFLTNYDK